MHKGVEVGLEIMRVKFNVQAQHITKVNFTPTKQPDAISSGALMCYYAGKIINGNIYIFCFTFAHFKGVYLCTSLDL